MKFGVNSLGAVLAAGAGASEPVAAIGSHSAGAAGAQPARPAAPAATAAVAPRPRNWRRLNFFSIVSLPWERAAIASSRVAFDEGDFTVIGRENLHQIGGEISGCGLATASPDSGEACVFPGETWWLLATSKKREVLRLFGCPGNFRESRVHLPYTGVGRDLWIM